MKIAFVASMTPAAYEALSERYGNHNPEEAEVLVADRKFKRPWLRLRRFPVSRRGSMGADWGP